MKTLTFKITLCLICISIYGVQALTIKGKLMDIQGNVIPYADIALLSMPDSTQIAAALSDESGNYLLPNISKGTYLLYAHMSELDETITKHILIDGAAEEYTHDLVLEVSHTEAERVVITSQKALVKQEADKLVMNIEGTLANSGLTGVDVLRRLPGVSVDKDGKINLKGKNGVQVMLDDKPLYMSEEQLAALLKSIPSDLIKEIEVITSPSAKYDAVGNGGVINIRLKEGAYEGLNGNANASYGRGLFYKTSAGLNLSYKKKKHAFDLGYQYNAGGTLDDFISLRTSLNERLSDEKLNSSGYYTGDRKTHSIFAKGKHQLYTSGQLSYNLNLAYRDVFWDGDNHTDRFDGEGVALERFHTRDQGLAGAGNATTGINFTHQFDTLGTKLSTELSYNGNYENVVKTILTTRQDSASSVTTPSSMWTTSRDRGQQWSAKADYTQTFWKKLKLETGLKVNQFYKSEPQRFKITEQSTIRDTNSNFHFKEYVHAGYLMLSTKHKNWKLQAGLRVENTFTQGEITAYDTTFTRHYTNLFPSGSASYEVSEKTSYTLMYSKRIQRPSADQLSPVINIVDPYTLWGGSPYLLPEYTHNLELAQSTFGGYLITTLNYSRTQNVIHWIMDVDPTTLKTVMGSRNLKHVQNAGVSFAVNLPITPWWQSSNYIYLYRNEIVGDMGFGVSGNTSNSFKTNCTQSFKLPKNFGVELSANYEARAAYSYGTSKPFGQVNVAVQKQFMKGKASIKLAYSDIFWTHHYRNEATYNQLFTVNTYRWDNKVLMCTLNYRFGKRLDL